MLTSWRGERRNLLNKPLMPKPTLLQSIRALEKACLAKGYVPTSAQDLKDNGKSESLDYYRWLRQQAPTTALSYPLALDYEG